MKVALVLMFLILVSGCGKFDVKVDPVADLSSVPQVCIIDNPETREGFRDAMVEWLNEENVGHEVIPKESKLDACNWVLTYFGKWAWDIAVFLSDAKISAYEDGELKGEVSLLVGQWDAYKFEKGSVRVKKMMDLLAAKIDSYPLPVKKKKEDSAY